MEVCVARDPKGLYAKASAGSLPNMTGIGQGSEPPEHADWHLAQVSRAPPPALRALLRDHPAACCVSLAIESALAQDHGDPFQEWRFFADVPSARVAWTGSASVPTRSATLAIPRSRRRSASPSWMRAAERGPP